MLSIIRVVLVTLYCILACIFGCIYCLFSPRNPRHVATFGHMFGRLSPLFGLKVETRIPAEATISNAVQTNTVTVGKKSLIWIPFFGLLYWLTGNLLIDRANRAKAHNTIAQVVNQFRTKTISFWMFPEGTRSRGRGLMPFKTGAFHAAIAAGVPIVPVCASNTNDKVKLNRWNNGLVIVEMLPPIDVTKYGKDQVRELSAYCHALMEAKINELNAEVAAREAQMREAKS
ncbi:MAG: 1-acylglycerol-3-phosphate O-acyltransferase [Hafnia sp.]